MKVHEQLLSKNGWATIIIARALMMVTVGERIPTVTELSEAFGLVRGTTQNALKNLTTSGAVTIESRGHLGSFLVDKNKKLLLEYAGLDSLVGAMPLPHSKRIEGLASGLTTTLENGYDLSTSIVFMRGARNRISLLLQQRYDFAVISHYSYQQFSLENPGLIQEVINFGPNSYISKYVLITRDPGVKEIQDGMKVGINKASVDRLSLTYELCEGKNVEFVEVEYAKVINFIETGTLDAYVANFDEIVEKNLNVYYQEIEENKDACTEAVLVVSSSRTEIGVILQELVDPDVVLKIQQLVIDGQLTPSY